MTIFLSDIKWVNLLVFFILFVWRTVRDKTTVRITNLYVIQLIINNFRQI